MNLTKIIGSAIVAGGIIAGSIPIIYNKQINKAIEIEKQALSQYNITLSEKTNKDSFIKTNREYILTIKDITPILLEINPNINPYDLKDLKKIFDNTKFLVTINLTKYPVYHKNGIKIDLLSLNKYSTKELKKDKLGKQLLEFIQNKGIEAILDINNVNISKITLKDINLNISDDINKFLIKSKNTYILFNKTITTNIDKVKFSIENKGFSKTTFSITNFRDNLNKTSLFNYKESSSIKNITYYSNNIYNDIKLNFNNITSNTQANTILSKLNSSTKININNADLKINKDNININNFKFNIEFLKLDLGSIKEIYKLANTTKPNEIEILNKINTLINKGFEIKIDPLYIDKALIIMDKQKLQIEPITINLNTTVIQNNAYIGNFSSLLEYIEGNLNIITTQKNINLLTSKNPTSAIFLAPIIQQYKNKIKINLSYKNGKIYSNGKQLF